MTPFFLIIGCIGFCFLLYAIVVAVGKLLIYIPAFLWAFVQSFTEPFSKKSKYYPVRWWGIGILIAFILSMWLCSISAT